MELVWWHGTRVLIGGNEDEEERPWTHTVHVDQCGQKVSRHEKIAKDTQRRRVRGWAGGDGLCEGERVKSEKGEGEEGGRSGYRHADSGLRDWLGDAPTSPRGVRGLI